MKFAAAALLASLAAGAALAEDLTPASMLGHTEDEVKATLVSMGYEVRKIEEEDGKIEAYFVKDKTMGEVYVDPASGIVSKLSMK
ncbi:PepSY domain-containing protein [Mangrovicoccus ximenensis]|uniref:PepSY domain-containing protein n=1 Tax=Mangrovicoccus ximenensis TaxID=1911570 RepID=UPI0013752142|nr:PepSY domain-containing protein [Mangrovicoccus ximenensis]